MSDPTWSEQQAIASDFHAALKARVGRDRCRQHNLRKNEDGTFTCVKCKATCTAGERKWYQEALRQVRENREATDAAFRKECEIKTVAGHTVLVPTAGGFVQMTPVEFMDVNRFFSRSCVSVQPDESVEAAIANWPFHIEPVGRFIPSEGAPEPCPSTPTTAPTATPTSTSSP
jgi:hypothetical protein